MSTHNEHIFDHSACLTRRQVKDYLNATMSTEESQAAEQHFSNCPLCREAMDGYLAHAEQGLQVLAACDGHFLKESAGLIQEQLQAKPVPVLSKPARRRRRLGQSPRFNSFVPVFLIMGALAFFRFEIDKPTTNHVAAKAEVKHIQPAHAPAIARTEPAPEPQPKHVTLKQQYPDAPVVTNSLKVEGVITRPDSAKPTPPVATLPKAEPQRAMAMVTKAAPKPATTPVTEAPKPERQASSLPAGGQLKEPPAQQAEQPKPKPAENAAKGPEMSQDYE